MAKVTYNDDEGAKAIIDLQKIMGIEESYADALVGWKNMTKEAKEGTETAHKLFCT